MAAIMSLWLVSDGVVGADTMAKINALLAETEVQTYESKYNNLVQDLKTLLNKYQ
jgi:outer membrane murein-binding lipoprotein Lpp